MRRLRTALLTALAVALAAAAPACASPFRGQCLGARPGVQCWIWPGKVTFVDDGDTINVDVHDGRGAQRIRLTGINTQELTRYSHSQSKWRGECHAIRGARRMAQLVHASHNRVRLYAIDPSSHSGPRPRRAVGVRVGGRWVDVGGVQIAAGNALWLPSPREWAWNLDYSTLAAQAAARRIGIWDPTGCGPGPDLGAVLQLIVNWDAPGDDQVNVNGEWMKVRNLDPAHPVDVSGWVLRGSDSRRFRLPAATTIPAGGEVTLHVGRGDDAGNDLHWNLDGPIFDNAGGRDTHDTGDGGYLFDPRGNLRAFMMYPCRIDCGDPLIGAVRLSADYASPAESVLAQNVSNRTIDLEGYRLRTPYYVYPLPAGSVLAPGETLRVFMDGSSSRDSRLVKFWGLSGPSLKNGGDMVELSSPTGVRVGCAAWGDARC